MQTNILLQEAAVDVQQRSVNDVTLLDGTQLDRISHNVWVTTTPIVIGAVGIPDGSLITIEVGIRGVTGDYVFGPFYPIHSDKPLHLDNKRNVLTLLVPGIYRIRYLGSGFDTVRASWWESILNVPHQYGLQTQYHPLSDTSLVFNSNTQTNQTLEDYIMAFTTATASTFGFARRHGTAVGLTAAPSSDATQTLTFDTLIAEDALTGSSSGTNIMGTLPVGTYSIRATRRVTSGNSDMTTCKLQLLVGGVIVAETDETAGGSSTLTTMDIVVESTFKVTTAGALSMKLIYRGTGMTMPADGGIDAQGDRQEIELSVLA